MTRYSKRGETETLAQLNVARYNHACSSYLNDEGDHVRLILNISQYIISLIKVLLVTGGRQDSDDDDIFFDSTEVLSDLAGTWRLTGSLPSARSWLSAASVDNNIFVFGEIILYYNYIDHLIISDNLYNVAIIYRRSEQMGYSE